MELGTIGYEAADINDFLETLRVAKVDVLVDVRDIAVSRRKGFSKTALSLALESHGIEYIHLRGLGDPKPGREAARRGDFDAFKKIFGEHMYTEKAVADLNRAIEISSTQRACLMCYERDPTNCHRTIVARTISEHNQCKIRPLGVKEGIGNDQQKSRERQCTDARKGSTTRGRAAR